MSGVKMRTIEVKNVAVGQRYGIHRWNINDGEAGQFVWSGNGTAPKVGDKLTVFARNGLYVGYAINEQIVTGPLSPDEVRRKMELNNMVGAFYECEASMCNFVYGIDRPSEAAVKAAVEALNAGQFGPTRT
jgi:hypothetical protein